MTVTTTTSAPASGITAAEATAYLALVQAQAAARAQLTQAAVDVVLSYLELFNGWWDTDAITDLTSRIVKQVQPAQQRAARLTDAYVARVISKQRGRTVRPAGITDLSQLRRKLPQDAIEKLARDDFDVPVIEIGDTFDGPNENIEAELQDLMDLVEVPAEWREPAEAYGRIADQYRWAVIAGGASDEEALAKAKQRAEQVVDTDIALAVREQEGHTARKLGVKLYRRVLHPEIAETGLSCGLCIVAADRVYGVERFKRELHLHCHCEMVPIDSGKDPAVRLNDDDLKSLYRAAAISLGREGGEETGGGKRQKGALKRVRVGITEHGELGPILINQSGEYRTVKDFAKTQATSAKVRAAAQLPAMLESLARLEARWADGDKTTKSPIEFHRRRIAELRRLAG
jgi:hypothetical protein